MSATTGLSPKSQFPWRCYIKPARAICKWNGLIVTPNLQGSAGKGRKVLANLLFERPAGLREYYGWFCLRALHHIKKCLNVHGPSEQSVNTKATTSAVSIFKTAVGMSSGASKAQWPDIIPTKGIPKWNRRSGSPGINWDLPEIPWHCHSARAMQEGVDQCHL